MSHGPSDHEPMGTAAAVCQHLFNGHGVTFTQHEWSQLLAMEPGDRFAQIGGLHSLHHDGQEVVRSIA